MRERSSNSETNVSRDVLVTKLQGELIILRTKADLTQEELASVIGLSRQTYCQIEKGNAKMAWSVYLALLLFFNSIPSTAELLPLLGIEVESILYNLNMPERMRVDVGEVVPLGKFAEPCGDSVRDHRLPES